MHLSIKGSSVTPSTRPTRPGRFEEIRFGVSPGRLPVPVPLLRVTSASLWRQSRSRPRPSPPCWGCATKGTCPRLWSIRLFSARGSLCATCPGKGPELIVDSRLVDTLGAGLEYFQPLGRRLFVDGFFRYSLSRDLFLQGDSAQVGRDSVRSRRGVDRVPPRAVYRDHGSLCGTRAATSIRPCPLPSRPPPRLRGSCSPWIRAREQSSPRGVSASGSAMTRP